MLIAHFNYCKSQAVIARQNILIYFFIFDFRQTKSSKSKTKTSKENGLIEQTKT